MMNKLMKKITLFMMAVLVFCTSSLVVNATQTEDVSNPLGFEIEFYEYEIVEEATQDDMPTGFTIGISF